MTPKVGWLAAKSTMFLIGDTSTHSWLGVSSDRHVSFREGRFFAQHFLEKMDERF